MQKPDITFYCGVNEKDWSYHPTAPGPYACVAPVYGRSLRTRTTNSVHLPPDTKVMVDSGAFSDATDRRLTFEQALHRQVAHAYRFGYVNQITHIASYDCLIDEKWQDGTRRKQRWSYAEAETATQETVQAAAYLAAKRQRVSGIFGHRIHFILSAQSVTADQYLHCAKQIVPLLQPGDIFGLGGFCITGLMPAAMLPPFRSIIRLVIPYLSEHSIRRVHIWGVCFGKALGELLALCDRYGIQLSTDSSGPQRNPLLGQWGYGSWRDNRYMTAPILDSCRALDRDGKKAPTCPPGTFCRGLERTRHVQLTREWLADFRERERELYHAV